MISTKLRVLIFLFLLAMEFLIVGCGSIHLGKLGGDW